MSLLLEPPIRQEFEVAPTPLGKAAAERPLPLYERIWQQGWLRKTLILLALAVIWEAAARWPMAWRSRIHGRRRH